MQIVLETERLNLRRPTTEDAAFFLRILNQPSWLRFIGDHGVHDVLGAVDYIIDGPQTMYVEHGFALCVCELRDSGIPVGLCGIVKRAALPLPDLGFAFLDEYEGQGYAREAARASLAMARDALRLEKVFAVAKPDNARSIRLLQRLGFQSSGPLKLAPEQTDVTLFECAL